MKTSLQLIRQFIDSRRRNYPMSIAKFMHNKLLELGFTEDQDDHHPKYFVGDLWVILSPAPNVMRVERRIKLHHSELYACHIPQNESEFGIVWEEIKKLL